MNKIKTMLMAVMVFTFHLSPFTLPAQTQQLPLSETATASVITCGAGNEFYHSFCHSALRIQDTARGIDFVYNYGTFDFDTPHFYWKFARGRLNYCLSRSTFQHFIAAYDYERRAVWEQPLNFTPQEVANLFYALEWNYLPENRYYRYDFFRDNCATRVRDMVEAANGKCKIAYARAWKDHSYRYWLHQATAGGRLEWWMLGVDLLLGLSADHVCDISESMFYPMAMMWLYSSATRSAVSGANVCSAKPLVAPTIEWLQDHRPPLKRSFPPLVVFGLLFAAVALLTWKKLWPHWADRLLFIIAGLLGLALLFMWFGTDHYCTAWNLNILWASPLLILIAIQDIKSRRDGKSKSQKANDSKSRKLEVMKTWALWLQEGCFAVALVWVIVCGLSPALLPVILTLALRVTALIIKH